MKNILVILAITPSIAIGGTLFDCKTTKVDGQKNVTCKREKNGVVKAYGYEEKRDDNGKVISRSFGPVTMIELTLKTDKSVVSPATLKPPQSSTIGVDANGNTYFK